MSLNKIDGKIVIKRSTIPGEVPVLGPSNDYTDGSWTGDTMIYPGEFFFNIPDESLFIGNSTGVTEFTAHSNYYTTGATLVGNTVFFDRNNSLSAYSVDLSSIAGGGSGGGNVIDGLNTYTGGSSSLTSVNISGGTVDNWTVTGNTILSATSASTITVLNSGATTIALQDYSSNIINTGVTNSTIAAGSGNTINADLRNVFVAGKDLTATQNDAAYFSKVFIGSTELKNRMNLSFAISDETTDITTGTNKLTIYAPYGFTLTEVRASLSTVGSSSSQFDINVNGSSILSTKLTIDSSEATSVTAAVPPVISSSTIADNDKITVDIDTAGTGAKGAKIYLIGY